ncbi:Protein Red [Psilocybe cubensis]|uniref:Protein Red n=2 Tax=Psilocybe cubensis TaxID=181762 RepID=A0ACB8GV95_PSICU|nr:Protein Red [Psilocybe cubensis]KAH9479362.1 Protein Red [Psilocybe cubensis]
MDQESFRRLLQTPRPGGSSTLGSASSSRSSLLPPPKKKIAEDASQPAFKPRTVKKKAPDAKTSKYRDRAAERRVGGGNDYAHVEAVLEDFERKNADEDKAKVEEQRKYLGGDSEHSILVKGLDFALLEQNKARSVMTNEDLDALDQAFLESSSHPPTTVPKKRTREELLRELKEQRAGSKSSNNFADGAADEEARLLEQAKLKGKFKPIGQPEVKKKKKLKSDGAEGEKKKKKRKVDNEDSTLSKANAPTGSSMPPPPDPVKAGSEPAKVDTTSVPAQEEVIDEDFDIFAGAGDYEGIDLGDDDEESETEANKPKSDNNPEIPRGKSPVPDGPRRWIETDDVELPTKPSIPLPTSITKQASSSRSSPPRHGDLSDDEDMEGDQPMRLVPLSSSALPSIKEFLAMDKAASSRDKKKKRKDKKNDGDDRDEESSKKSLEAKVDRDYQRLKSFTDKKAAADKK